MNARCMQEKPDRLWMLSLKAPDASSRVPGPSPASERPGESGAGSVLHRGKLKIQSWTESRRRNANADTCGNHISTTRGTFSLVSTSISTLLRSMQISPAKASFMLPGHSCNTSHHRYTPATLGVCIRSLTISAPIILCGTARYQLLSSVDQTCITYPCPPFTSDASRTGELWCQSKRRFVTL